MADFAALLIVTYMFLILMGLIGAARWGRTHVMSAFVPIADMVQKCGHVGF